MKMRTALSEAGTGDSQTGTATTGGGPGTTTTGDYNPATTSTTGTYQDDYVVSDPASNNPDDPAYDSGTGTGSGDDGFVDTDGHVHTNDHDDSFDDHDYNAGTPHEGGPDEGGSTRTAEEEEILASEPADVLRTQFGITDDEEILAGYNRVLSLDECTQQSVARFLDFLGEHPLPTTDDNDS